MALNFPTPTVDGQTYSAPNGIIYRWDATAGLWVTWGTGKNNAIISSTPPPNPVPGQLWFSDVLGQTFIFYVDANSSQWIPANASPTLGNPPGLISDFGGPVAPAGWYVCDGALVSRTTDAPLFAAIGTAHGAGDGSTTFALPDLRGRVTAGKEAAATRLTTSGSGIDGSVLGAAGGAQNHMLTLANLPSGVMSFQPYGASFYQINNAAAVYPGYQTDGAAPTQVVQPTLIVNKIIKR